LRRLGDFSASTNLLNLPSSIQLESSNAMALSDRWHLQWQRLGLDPPPGLWAELVAHYAESDRAYHNLHHIEFCLGQFDEVRGLAVQPAIVEAAIWFHDAIYDPQRADNEEQSAAWAASVLAGAGAEPNIAQRVADLILATKHVRPPTDDDMALLLDIDLAILGQPPALFEQYEQVIRQEYNWVGEGSYRSGRVAILQRFLDRKRIYATEPLYLRYEQQARANLTRSIDRLGNDWAVRPGSSL
jgi:predicted metal-dependent HD superfamily phosphohydrolase